MAEGQEGMASIGEPSPENIAGQEPLSMIRMNRKPAVVLKEAEEAASALMAAVRKHGWAVMISGREHLRVEAWQTVGMFYGLTARITETREVVLGDARGFKAKAVVVHAASGRVLSAGEMYCMNDEDNWGTRPKYKWNDAKKKNELVGQSPVPMFQLASMAETRAVSKALRNCLSWVVVLAGYDPTPAEEAGGENISGAEPSVDQPKRASTSPGAQGKTLILNLDNQGLALTGNATYDLKDEIKRSGGKTGKATDGESFAWRFGADALNTIRELAQVTGVTMEESDAVKGLDRPIDDVPF